MQTTGYQQSMFVQPTPRYHNHILLQLSKRKDDNNEILDEDDADKSNDYNTYQNLIQYESEYGECYHLEMKSV